MQARNKTYQSVLLHCNTCVLMRSRVLYNRVIKIGSGQKKVLPSSNLISSHGSLKSRNSQHAHAKVGVTQTAFTYSSVALQPIRVKETSVTRELRIDCTRKLHSCSWNSYTT